jgi:hypothetical protein
MLIYIGIFYFHFALFWFGACAGINAERGNTSFLDITAAFMCGLVWPAIYAVMGFDSFKRWRSGH